MLVKSLLPMARPGRILQKMGLKGKFVPEDLVMDQPDIMLKLETAFVEAGSDIILTCTFGGTRSADERIQICGSSSMKSTSAPSNWRARQPPHGRMSWWQAPSVRPDC